jgi:integrase
MIVENVATLVDPPTVDETEANPFTMEEAKAFLLAAAKRPTFMRWLVGVGMGFRQGEALGLRWKYVDLEGELFSPHWQLQRLTWRHGCTGPAPLRRAPAPLREVPQELHDAQGLQAWLPQPCPPGCTRHASVCPKRKGGGLVFIRPKTKKSRNTVPIPTPFIPYLRTHKEQQDTARAAAGEQGQDFDAVFTRPDGRPIDPRDDWDEFKELLEETGISDRRLYDGSRHTAGTILNELGVDMPTIMEILRHTQSSQTRRYVKGRSTLSKDAMLRMGNAFTPSPNRRLRPELRPSTVRRPAPDDTTGSPDDESPGQSKPDLGFHRAPCRIRTDDLRITRP